MRRRQRGRHRFVLAHEFGGASRAGRLEVIDFDLDAVDEYARHVCNRVGTIDLHRLFAIAQIREGVLGHTHSQ